MSGDLTGLCLYMLSLESQCIPVEVDVDKSLDKELLKCQFPTAIEKLDLSILELFSHGNQRFNLLQDPVPEPNGV